MVIFRKLFQIAWLYIPGPSLDLHAEKFKNLIFLLFCEFWNSDSVFGN